MGRSLYEKIRQFKQINLQTQETLLYLGRHPKPDDRTDSESSQLIGTGGDAPAISRAVAIEHLLDKDSRQAQTQALTKFNF